MTVRIDLMEGGLLPHTIVLRGIRRMLRKCLPLAFFDQVLGPRHKGQVLDRICSAG